MTQFIAILVFCLIILIYGIIEMKMHGSTLRANHTKQVFDKLKDMEPKGKKKKISIRYFGKKEYVMLLMPVGAVTFVFSILFFRSVNMALVCTLGSFFYPMYLIKQKKVKEKRILNYQFREALISISNSVKAGASLSNAIEIAEKDLRKMYGTSKVKPIVHELEITVQEMNMGISIIDVLENLKRRTQIEDISDFVNVAIMTKKQGGNLAAIIANVASIITDRIQVEKEINTLVASKQMEAKILTVTPVGLVFLISFTSPEYMQPMYETLMGRALLLLGVVLLALNYFIGKKIINIEI